ncbi:hypothetical protein [Nitratireductor sp. GCM10026969]|uniref:hypothetical protein n=1 Tax=Nitratireductor sp. GCM10026969 TaxID=3252645 RepID=UPI00360AB809
MPGILRLAAAFAALFLLGAQPADDGSWPAGGFSFSDELGGFRILDVSGRGTRAEPIVLTQELYSASAVVMVVRIPDRSAALSTRTRTGMTLYLQLNTLNASGLPWVEFAFELQAQLGIPSTFGDGLSFDQVAREPTTIASDRFDLYTRDFEPSDRLLFRQGHVDPRQEAVFSFLITDLTPTYQFHLVQDPRIPSS